MGCSELFHVLWSVWRFVMQVLGYVYKNLFTEQDISEVLFSFVSNLLCLEFLIFLFLLKVIIWLICALYSKIMCSFASSVHRSKLTKTCTHLLGCRELGEEEQRDELVSFSKSYSIMSCGLFEV